MEEIITQTLLLTNECGFTKCYSRTNKNEHANAIANHMNACSNFGGNSTKHNRVRDRLIRMLKTEGKIEPSKEKYIDSENKTRVDIILGNELIDITCVQTSQNNKTLEKAFATAWHKKDEFYKKAIAEAKTKKTLLTPFQQDTRTIPIVIGPRGQIHKESYKQLLRIFKVRSKATRDKETKGI